MRGLETTARMIALLGVLGSASACADKKPAATPVGGGTAGPATAGTGQPGVGAQPQYGVVDTAPEGAPKMNAQAAALYQQAIQAWSQGNLQRAQALFGQAAQADANAYQAHFSLGVLQERLGQQGAALASYRKSYRIVPQYDRAIVAEALLLAKTGKAPEGEQLLTRERAKRSKSLLLTTGLAEVKSLQDDSTGAQQLAREALKVDPTFAPAMLVIARDHYRNRKLDLALYSLRAMLDSSAASPARSPNNPEAMLLRAVIYDEQDEEVAAIEA
ncbi:MAG: tetratricopeptide repeat protein [Myxococcota bacterium]